MNSTVCPTVLAQEPHGYRAQMERVEPFASRIHVDVADGVFAPNKTVGFDQVWWRGDRTIDLHVMYRRPGDHVEIILALRPRLVIVHAEAEGDFFAFAEALHAHGIEVGLALLPPTSVEQVAPALPHIEHVLIFSGNLGHFGGEADLHLLEKAAQAKTVNPRIEVGWDGGVNAFNAKRLADGGVDVLNVGGYIQRSERPSQAYATLVAAIKN